MSEIIVVFACTCRRHELSTLHHVTSSGILSPTYFHPVRRNLHVASEETWIRSSSTLTLTLFRFFNLRARCGLCVASSSTRVLLLQTIQMPQMAFRMRVADDGSLFSHFAAMYPAF